MKINKGIISFLIMLLMTVCVFAENEQLVSECSLSGNVVTVSGEGEDIKLFVLNPGKTVEELKAADDLESFKQTVNYTNTFNVGKYDEYNKSITIKNFNSNSSYLLYVSDKTGEYIEELGNTAENILSLDLSQVLDDVTLKADVSGTNAQFIRFIAAEYNTNGKLVSVNLEDVAVKNKKASGEVCLNDVTAGNKVKAFVWTDDFSPVSNLYEYNMEITVKTTAELYGEELSENSYEAPAATNFYNNKTAAVSVTFDDSVYSAAEYYDSLFEKYGMRGTAMLVSDWITERNGVAGAGIESWQELIDRGNIDIANHSKTHKLKYTTDNPTSEQLEADITGGYNALKEYFPNEQILGFAAPWIQNPDAAVSEIKKHHYVNRASGNGGFVDADPTEEMWYNLPSFVVNQQDISVLNGKIDTAIEEGKWFVHLMHTVGGGEYEITKDVCDNHFAYIASKSDKVWAGSLNDVTKYIRERQNSKISYNWIREKAMSITVTDTLDDLLFDFPLTVKVNVPSEWSEARCYMNRELAELEVVLENGNKYVYVNVIPDKGDIILENF